MRLIDADAFKEYMRKALEETRGCYPDKGEWAEAITEQFCKDIDDQPTIEPHHWIPCSETPDTDRNVFVVRGEHEFMSVCIGHYGHDNNQWYEDRNWFAKCLYDGLYWCEIPPLPEPYKEAET